MLEGTALGENARYRLVALIGEGGMATVYRAWDRRLRVWRAIKLLKTSTMASSVQLARFEREASTMARLSHPNVLAVHDVAQEDGQQWIVMDLAPGGSLAVFVETGIAPRLAVRLVRGALRGLHHAHEHGVVHRDVKPHNILLAADGTPLVGDFGIARVEAHDLTRSGATIGTLAYMAPEQRGTARDVDRRADVYGAACTLYALITGREPFDLFVDGPWDGVPPALIPILRRATSHDPRRRPSTAAELAEQLAAIEAELPATAHDEVGALRIPAAAPAPLEDEGDPPQTPSASQTLDVAALSVEQRPRFSRRPLGVALLGVAGASLVAILVATRPRHDWLEDSPERRISRGDPAADPVRALSASPDGSLLYLTPSGLWRAGDGEPSEILPQTPGAAWSSASALPGGAAIVSTEGNAFALAADGSTRDLGYGGFVVGFSADRVAVLDERGISVGPLDGVKTVLDPGSWADVGTLAWSPDGSWLAVERGAPNPRIELVAADGGERRVVRTAGRLAPQGIGGLAWVDDHRLLWTESWGEADSALWAQSLDDARRPTGAPERLRIWPGVIAGELAYAAGRLSYVHVASNQDVWVADLDGDRIRAPSRVTTDPKSEVPVGWFGDGRLAWRATLGKSAALWVGTPGGTDAIDWGGRWDVSQTAGDAILAFRQGEDGTTSLYRLDGPGRRALLRTFPAGETIGLGCLEGRCALGESTGASLTIGWIDRDGAMTPIATLHTEIAGNWPGIYPDHTGGAIAVTADEQRLWVVQATGEVQEVAFPALVQTFAWLPGDEAAILGCYAGSTWMLGRSDLRGGQTPIPLVESHGWIAAPAVSPDGRRIAWTEDPMSADVWSIEVPRGR